MLCKVRGGTSTFDHSCGKSTCKICNLLGYLAKVVTVVLQRKRVFWQKLSRCYYIEFSSKEYFEFNSLNLTANKNMLIKDFFINLKNDDKYFKMEKQITVILYIIHTNTSSTVTSSAVF